MLNIKTIGRTANGVYIGQGSRCGTPLQIGVGGDRADVIARHERWLRDRHELLRALRALMREDLMCFCALGLSWRSAAAAGERYTKRIAW